MRAFFSNRSFIIFIGLGLLLPNLACAWQWQKLWLSPDQRAFSFLEKQNPNQAANTFKDPLWKGVAYYKAKQYKLAYQQFRKFDSALAYYNQGNTLAQLHRYQQAIRSYQTALKKQPNYPDAQHNIEVLKKLLSKLNNRSKQKNSEKNNNSNKQPQNKSASKHKNLQPNPTKPKVHSKTKAWLRQLPDNPGGLLKQKFLRNYLRRHREHNDAYSNN